MRCVSIALLLAAAALAVPGECFAQAPARTAAATHASADGADTATAAAATVPSPAAPDDDRSRSAFGKVMAVMISALQHQARAQREPAAPVRTTASGTPMGIEVGAAFDIGTDPDRTHGRATRAMNAGKPQTGTGSAAATERSRAAPPEELALRQAALVPG